MALPNFLVIGAGRSGTTSLHHYLRHHPEIFVCLEKSPNYFVSSEPMPSWENPRARAMARQWVSDRGAYERLFDGARNEKAVGEVSPVYLQALGAPRRIRAACPDAKIVAVLREPVDRAYAHFFGRRRDGLELRPDFEGVVEEELSRPLPDDVAFGSYLGCGRYHHFLKGYFDLFPRARIRVYLFEDLRADTGALLRDLFTFLGADPSFVPGTERRHNRTGEIANSLLRFLWTWSAPARTAMRPYLPAFIRSGSSVISSVRLERPALDPALRARLVEVFHEDIELLGDMIGRDLSGWLELGDRGD